MLSSGQDNAVLVLPSAAQSATLSVQGPWKVSGRSLVVLFCLSVSFATFAPLLPACLLILAWQGESSPSCPQLLMHPAWLSQDDMGAIQPN